jgi:histidinol-phosphatase (PHP family)
VIVDYHMHLRDPGGRIDHTTSAIEIFAETAAARGVDEIGFTEHVYYFRQTLAVWDHAYESERCVYDLDAYVDAIVEAKRRGLPVKLGLEVDYVGGRQDELAAALDPYPWDLLLGSVHRVDGLALDSAPDDEIWAVAPVDETWQRYFSALAELAASGHVDVLAHPDLPKIFGLRPEGGIHYPPLEDVALEISTNGLYKPVGELYPDPEFLAAARLPITLASDAHVPANVGRDFDRALELARSAGYETLTVFEARRPRQEPLG